MWEDILRKGTRKINGNILREVLADYIQSSGSLDMYFVDKVIEVVFEMYKELERTVIPFKTSVIHERIFKNKIGLILGNYLPEEYEIIRYSKKILPDGSVNPSFVPKSRGQEKIKLIVKKKIKVEDEDLEKIRTRSGNRLKLKDWEAFKTDLRAGLNTIVPRDIYGRKSSVRIVDGDFVDNKATLNVSFRSLQTDRRYIFINFIEEDGDYYFTTIEGNVQIFDDEVIQTEAQLRERVIDLVEEFYVEEKREYDLREKEEDELTEEENIRQLEAANPDSYWDREKSKLVQREIEPEEPPARDLNLEEAAKLGAKAKEKADKVRNLLAEKRRKKTSMTNIKPQRGKRGRKDVP
jgi:hypothetical protein